MAASEHPRVVLQFNAYDFRHRKVLEVMRARDRNKTELVVNAILHYISCPDAGEEFGKEMIRKTVIEVIQEMQASGTLGIASPAPVQSNAFNAEDAADLGGLMDMFRGDN